MPVVPVALTLVEAASEVVEGLAVVLKEALEVWMEESLSSPIICVAPTVALGYSGVEETTELVGVMLPSLLSGSGVLVSAAGAVDESSAFRVEERLELGLEEEDAEIRLWTIFSEGSFPLPPEFVG